MYRVRIGTGISYEMGIALRAAALADNDRDRVVTLREDVPGHDAFIRQLLSRHEFRTFIGVQYTDADGVDFISEVWARAGTDPMDLDWKETVFIEHFAAPDNGGT